MKPQGILNNPRKALLNFKPPNENNLRKPGGDSQPLSIQQNIKSTIIGYELNEVPEQEE
jgi:hypothetical protein